MSTKTCGRGMPIKTGGTDIEVMYRETGPEGYPVVCTDEGDLAQVVVDEEGFRSVDVFFRGEQSVARALADLSDRLYHEAHRQTQAAIATGEIRLTDEMESKFADAEVRLRELDERYGRDFPRSQYDCGMTVGKIAALLWLEGGERGSTDELIREDGTPFIIRRSLDDVRKEVAILREKAWWNHHQNWLWEIERGMDEIGCEKIFASARKSARRIEKKYGKENLGWSDYEWGMLSGHLSALRWVLGYDWDMLDV